MKRYIDKKWSRDDFDEIKPPGPAAPNFNEGAGLPPRPGPRTPVIPCYRIEGSGYQYYFKYRQCIALQCCQCLLSVLQSRNSYWPQSAFNALFHILFYVQLYINVNSLQRVTRIHNHYSQNDKIVKLGLPRPWIKAVCKKYEDWDPAVCLKKSQKYNSGVVLIINPFRIRVVVQLQKFGHRDQECRKLQIGYHNKISSVKFSFKIIRIERLA